MDDEYVETLIKDFIGTVDKIPNTFGPFETEIIEHELRNLITKVILHTQVDMGVGEP